MLRDILYQDAISYAIDNDYYISYKDESIKKSTVIQLGGQLIWKDNDFRELWIIQSKMADTYWIIQDVRPSNSIAYKAYKSPF